MMTCGVESCTTTTEVELDWVSISIVALFSIHF